MIRSASPTKWRPVTLTTGVVMLVCFSLISQLPRLRGPGIIPFLIYFFISSTAYLIAVKRLEDDHIPIILIWIMGLCFRIPLLFTSPTLSDDVYRYIWDGHLITQGINPYAHAVNSSILDLYSTPFRELINNNWMASPYLPVAQAYFMVTAWIAPFSIKIFQIMSMLLDLGTAYFIMAILNLLNLQSRRILIFIWNPLIIISFAHSAHIDALMVFLMSLSYWFIARATPNYSNKKWFKSFSTVSLAASTLTKALPILVAPIFFRRWGILRLGLFGFLIIASSSLLAAGAGWGLTGPSDGTGLFGAIRIYAMYWNYNSGIYHWLEVLISGYQTPGAVPIEIVGEAPIRIAKLIVIFLISLVTIATGIWAWYLDNPGLGSHRMRSLNLLRLAAIPIGAYLLLTTTVHPWYVTLILPLIPFLLPAKNETSTLGRFIWPWLYFSCAVSISYLSYIDPNNYREFYFVRWVEYIPFYFLLIWAAWPYLRQVLLEREPSCTS